MKKALRIILFMLLGFYQQFGLSQKDSIWYDISAIVYLDSLTIVASRHSFSVEDFIRLVQNDRSMEKAFQNIRFHSYAFTNDIRFFDRSGTEKASYQSSNIQEIKNSCRSMKVHEEQIKGKYYKRNGEYKFYTSTLYDRIFYTQGIICDDSSSVISYTEKSSANSKMEKQVLELKKLIFNPGQKSDIILIGDKTEIFSPDMQPYYIYEISQGKEPGGRDCYIFSAKAKDEYSKTNKIVVQYVESYFEKGSLDVLARNYGLAYSTPAYKFDVEMEVRLSKMGDLHVPVYIDYNGMWKITGYKTERARFSTNLFRFEQEM